MRILKKLCHFRLRLHCKRNKLVRELEETVRLASSLHAQLKRSVAYFGSPHPQKVGRSGLLGEEPRTAFSADSAALLYSHLLRKMGSFFRFSNEETCEDRADFKGGQTGPM